MSIATVLVVSQDLNITYPADTYENLAFPWLKLTNLTEAASDASSVTTTVAALMLGLNCQRINYTGILTDEGWTMNRTFTCSDGSTVSRSYTPLIFPQKTETGEVSLTRDYFGFSYDDGDRIRDVLCNGTTKGPELHSRHNDTDLTLVWGKLPQTYPSPPEFVAAWQCGQEWQEVDALVTYKGEDLAIDTSNPPVPDLSTRRAAKASIPFPYNLKKSIPELPI